MTDNTKSLLESLLFVSQVPLTIESIRSVLQDISSQQIHKHLQELKQEYKDKNRGLRIVEVAGGFQMVTDPQLSGYIKKFFRRPREKLLRASLETLGIIAYKQPITRREISQIRQVEVSQIIENLTNKGLLRVVGRKKVPGRPFVYGTTRQFLLHFGLNSLKELPKIEDFKKWGLSKRFDQGGNKNGVDSVAKKG
ncbi:MAG: SMC-Scp complex subunit ScpB [Candidatus Omnitrophica bacterium]|nr:SMC-Scp complex subunit ScpB [Candidatus Omnitrophota bacterium]